MFSDRTNWTLSQNRLAQAVEQVRASGAKILDLTVSNPTRVGLRYDSKAILEAFASPRSLDYDPQPLGLLPAREAVSAYYATHAVTLDPQRIVLTSSTSEGYSFVFRLLCNAGDELLVPKPSYPLFEFLADLQDVKLVPYPLLYDHGWQIDFTMMKEAVTPRTRGVVVVHPNNPTGSFVAREERGPLDEFCRDHRLALIVDEVFLDYDFDGDTRAKAAHMAGREKSGTFAANHQVLTFTLSGLSKICALPQMKVAWVVTTGPGADVTAAMARLEVIADTYLSMNAPVQWALPTLLDQRKTIQPQLLEAARRNLAELDRQLVARGDCRRLEVQGGWNAVLRVPVTQPDEELAISLLRKESALVHPGHFYDFPSDGYLVLSLICPEQGFAEGVARVLKHMES